MGAAEAKAAILANKTALGIEFGSTRIKAVLQAFHPLSHHHCIDLFPDSTWYPELLSRFFLPYIVLALIIFSH